MNAIRAMLAQGRMAAPAAAQEGSDVAFAFDGVKWTASEYDEINGWFTLTIEFALGGVGITGEAAAFAYVVQDGLPGTLSKPYIEADDTVSVSASQVDVGGIIYLLRHTNSGIAGKLVKGDALSGDYRIIVLLPSGAVATSPLLTIPGGT